MKRSHKKRLFGAAALAGAAFLGTCIWALQSTLGVSQYEVALPQGMEGLDGYRIVQIADLHSAKLDQELEQALEQLQPHLIVMTGDLVNREDRDFSQALATAALAVRFAPTYFVRGNHEVDNPDYAILRRGLEEAGVTILELTMCCSPTGPACWRPTGPAGQTWCSPVTPTEDRYACQCLERCLLRIRGFGRR